MTIEWEKTRACGVLGISLTSRSIVAHEREIASRDRQIAELEAENQEMRLGLDNPDGPSGAEVSACCPGPTDDDDAIAAAKSRMRLPTGPYCLHCGGQHLGIEYKMRAAEVERDDARERARRAAQVLIAEFGADGAMDVDQAAERAVKVARKRADAIVDRICSAVRREYRGGVDRVHMGTTYLGSTEDGPGFVSSIRDEIRKAAKP